MNKHTAVHQSTMRSSNILSLKSNVLSIISNILCLTSNVYCLLSIVILLTGCSKNDEHTHQDEYTCPMHPTVVQDKPGSCPLCGMDLVLKSKTNMGVKATPDLNYLLLPVDFAIASSIKAITPVLKSEEVWAETNGAITYDTRRITTIPIRMSGRIEKLSIKYNFQPVHKGEKILEIYSPELLTAQRDLLYLLKSDAENTSLVESAKEKLKLLGVTDSQIKQIIVTKKEMYSFPIFSSVDGYSVEETALRATIPTNALATPSASSGINGEAPMKSSANVSTQREIQVREGTYVTSGQTLFNVVNTEQVWAEFNVRQEDIGKIEINDSIHLSFDQKQNEIKSRIDFIQPFYQDGENFTKVRVYLANYKNKYQIGQLVTGRIKTKSERGLWIPTTARLDLGAGTVVFVKRKDGFRPKEISTGQQFGEWIEVLHGLEAHDSIAYDAHFLMDGESFVKVNR